MEDEDKHALEGIEGGKEVGHDDRVFIDKQEAESPRQPEQKQQSDGPESPRPDASGNGKTVVGNDRSEASSTVTQHAANHVCPSLRWAGLGAQSTSDFFWNKLTST